jgi:DNA-directed RNA polymerase specialized sigma24 family protein
MSDGRIQPEKGTGVLKVVDGKGAFPGSLVREAATSVDALERLCDHYIPKIYNFILKRVGSVPDAEDITSITFEKVIVNLGSFDETRASFTTWIYKIAANSVTDFYRSRGRLPWTTRSRGPSLAMWTSWRGRTCTWCWSTS